MSNFEMKYTIRLYDPELVVEIGKLYKAHLKEFRNKNEFMTCLIRLGVDALNAMPPTTPAAAAVPPAMALDKLYEEMRKIESITDETGKFLKVQGAENGYTYRGNGKVACVTLQYEVGRPFGRTAPPAQSRGRLFRRLAATV